MSSIRVGLIGREGSMGLAAAEWIEASPDLELVAAIGRGEEWAPLTESTVVLELTVAGQGMEHGMRLLEMGLRPVIGTSGVSPEEASELDAVARASGLGGVVVPNFSAVMVLLTQAALSLGELLPDLSIVDAHRAEKRDAPSGTAVDAARRLGLELSELSSIRMHGVTAIHELRLRGEADEVLLRHESLGRASFRGGLLSSLRYASSATGVAYGLEAVLGGACKLSGST